jgi:hypothetical protein
MMSENGVGRGKIRKTKNRKQNEKKLFDYWP